MILWVRHGQSTWNVMDRLQGHEPSPPLTDLGREQAAAAAEALADAEVVRVLSSPAVRALETAQIIAGRLGLEVDIEPLLLEKGLEEEMTNVLVRVRRLLDLDLPDHTVAVSHGDTIGLAVGLLSGQRPELPGNGSITRVDPATREVTVERPLVDPRGARP
ncbi:histidine phosphatase family protein [Aeromicrobium sp.]|uniref:histidine phosphatase family protein n=1 Tax=Aeromicrobium sp. TaxID=1871063 RepID=UPI0019831B14|nr:histidine phosphatase family protein [Aeromicrobium sp.]MBC7630626.1 histidine phosphatase family protein [Aeromicrobium sp.]